jgi:hypothetical protein
MPDSNQPQGPSDAAGLRDLLNLLLIVAVGAALLAAIFFFAVVLILNPHFADFQGPLTGGNRRSDIRVGTAYGCIASVIAFYCELFRRKFVRKLRN